MQSIDLAYRNLANAIIVQAANDYRKALDGKSYSDNVRKDAGYVIKECESFFHSKWYRKLTKVKGDFLIEQLKREHNEKVRKEQLCESN